jgi:DNA-binding beta-propeller fold protein YncE
MALAAPAVAAQAPTPARPARSYTLFESGHVRPLALTPSGRLLLATNTPDNRLEVFSVEDAGLVHRTSVPVGLEPVAVAARSDTEVWVVNHLSDSVSVVSLDAEGRSGRVTRTLLVGDEPRDIVFAGPERRRAFITTAHRGQNAPYDPRLTTPGIGRADVWVFDASRPGTPLGGEPLTILQLFSDTPRALAVTPDGSRVYAAAFHSGNRTTAIHERLVPNGFDKNKKGQPGLPGPSTNFEGIPAPESGLILQFDGAHWVDEEGRAWDDKVKFSLPDKDVFVIDAMAEVPRQLDGAAGFYSGVGTILYNLAVNPVSGKVYVSNTESRNLHRFEGPGTFAGHSVRGHTVENRITVLDARGVHPRHLNKHIDYSKCCAPVPNEEGARSLALPQAMAVTADGKTLYVAALGSDKVGVFDTAALENDTFVPDVKSQMHVPGGGPTGLVLDEARGRLYVLTRFDNAISVLSTASRTEVAHVPMASPEPPGIVKGRRYLYDAAFSSSHGDTACASCHVYGDFDSLAWDLGNPDAPVTPVAGPFVVEPLTNALYQEPIQDPKFHPMKGPTTTQSLRGLANAGPMHWHGERTRATRGKSAQPDTGAFDERAAFLEASGFVNLLGRSEMPSEAVMKDFTDFALALTYPPNPIRRLDNSLTPDQEVGAQEFLTRNANTVATCIGCHTLDPKAHPDSASPGFFGTDGKIAFDFNPQLMKTPHLRNMYQKVGMFGMALAGEAFLKGDNDFMGDQVRGFGFTHSGSIDTIHRFFSNLGFTTLFSPGGFPFTEEGNALRRKIESFMFVFPSNLDPIVGQQVTLTASNAAVAGPRIDLLRARADVGECDLVVKGQDAKRELGFVWRPGSGFQPDQRARKPLPDAAVRALVAKTGRELTYTCVPPGSGTRIGIDRDEDGVLDGDEPPAGRGVAATPAPKRGPAKKLSATGAP